MLKFLCGLLIFLFPFHGYGQNEISKRETLTEKCLNEKVAENDWNYLVNYFESYLIDNGFGEKSNIEKAYLKFIEFRVGPLKRMPRLSARAELKARLLKGGIIDGKRIYGFPFTDCFHTLNSDYEKFPESSLKDITSISEIISTADLSSSILMGGLGMSLKESDLKKSLYKRVVILLGFIDVIYLEELIDGEAKEDNPLLRNIQEIEIEKNRQSSEPITQDDPRLERKPQPEGGMASYLKWIYDNNNKLDSKEKLGKENRTVIIADIDESGNLINMAVWRGLGRGFDEEAHRLIKNHPTKKWTPATINGKPVKVTIEIEVDFRLK